MDIAARSFSRLEDCFEGTETRGREARLVNGAAAKGSETAWATEPLFWVLVGHDKIRVPKQSQVCSSELTFSVCLTVPAT